jgi:hypothetical protein
METQFRKHLACADTIDPDPSHIGLLSGGILLAPHPVSGLAKVMLNLVKLNEGRKN